MLVRTARTTHTPHTHTASAPTTTHEPNTNGLTITGDDPLDSYPRRVSRLTPGVNFF